VSSLDHRVVRTDPWHVVQPGHNGGRCFGCADDYASLHARLALLLERIPCAVHAYALLPGEVHLLLTAADAASVPRLLGAMSEVTGAASAGKGTGRDARWAERYRATAVVDGDDVLACCRQLELLPMESGLVSAPAQYRWSSHVANAFGRGDAVVTPHARYLALGATPELRRSAYRTLFEFAACDRPARGPRSSPAPAGAGRIAEWRRRFAGRRSGDDRRS